MDRASPYSRTFFSSPGVDLSWSVSQEHLEGYYESSGTLHTHSYCLLTHSYHGLPLACGCIKDKFFRWSEFLSVTFFLSAVFTSCFNWERWARISMWEQSQRYFPWRLPFSNVSLDILGHFSEEPSIYTRADFRAYNTDLTGAESLPVR